MIDTADDGTGEPTTLPIRMSRQLHRRVIAQHFQRVLLDRDGVAIAPRLSSAPDFAAAALTNEPAMPLIDLPLEQLKTYTGRTPRPETFDAYWQEAMAELRAVDPAISLQPAAFDTDAADCFDLTFTGVGGSRIYAKYLRPKARPPRGSAVLKFHGYTQQSGDWSRHLDLVAAGHCVAALDCRGQGGRSQDLGGVGGTTQNGHIIRGLEVGAESLLYRRIFLDTAQLADIVMNFDEVDADRVGTHGGSQGGALALVCAALEPRIKQVTAWSPFLCDYRRVWEMDRDLHAYAELRTFFRHRDPTHSRQAEWFDRLGHIDVQHLADRIRGRVLMGVGLMDDICPPSTQFAAFNKLTCPKELAVYPDFAHEDFPGFADQAYGRLAQM